MLSDSGKEGLVFAAQNCIRLCGIEAAIGSGPKGLVQGCIDQGSQYPEFQAEVQELIDNREEAEQVIAAALGLLS